MCAETYEETIERMEIVRSEFMLPNLQNPPEAFEWMSRHYANGLWCVNPFDYYPDMMFTIKRLNGVPDYYYFDSEMPESYDRKNLKLYTYSYRDRMIFYFSAMIRPLMSKSFVIWWFFNFSTDVNEFFIRNFPIFAFIKFGFKNSYVSDGL